MQVGCWAGAASTQVAGVGWPGSSPSVFAEQRNEPCFVAEGWEWKKGRSWALGGLGPQLPPDALAFSLQAECLWRSLPWPL